MRILYVTTVAITARAFLLPFIRHYRACGHVVDVMPAANGASADGLPEECDHVYDVQWRRSPLFAPLSMIEGLRLRKIIARNRYDIVHVHTPIAAFAYALLSCGHE